MKHGISEQDWEGYLTGALAPAEHDRVEAHLLGCLACWEHYDALQATARQVRTAAAEARRELALPDERLQHGFCRVMARLQPADAKPAQVQERLARLEAVMAGMCGTHTAAQALRAAAQGSPAQSLAAVSRENWEPFLERLTALTAVMCGDTAATLMRRQGFHYSG